STSTLDLTPAACDSAPESSARADHSDERAANVLPRKCGPAWECFLVTNFASTPARTSRTRTIVHDVHRHAGENPGRLALVFLRDGEEVSASLTYGELHQRARAVASELISASAPDDRTLLLFPPGLEFIVAFLGCLYAGRPAIPVAPPSPARVE